MFGAMVRKLVFSALAAVMTGVAAAVAYKAAATIWKAVTGEPPPESRLARMVVGGPVRSRVVKLLEAAF